MPALANQKEAVIEQVNEQIRSWRQPEVSAGDRVCWFQGHGGPQSRGCVAIVSYVDPNYVELVTLGRSQNLQCKKQARHVSDPRLRLGDDWTMYGTWDFLPPSTADRLLLAQVEALNGRFNLVEQKLARAEDTLIELQKENTEFKKRLAQQAKTPAKSEPLKEDK